MGHLTDRDGTYVVGQVCMVTYCVGLVLHTFVVEFANCGFWI